MLYTATVICKPTLIHDNIIIISHLLYVFSKSVLWLQPYTKGWFAARDICGYKVLANLVKFSHSHIKVGLQYMAYIAIKTKVHIIFNIKLCKYFHTNDTICCHWITPAGWRCEGRNITIYIISLLLTLARSSCLVFGRSIKMLLKQGRGTKHKQIGRLTCQVLKREVWKTYFEKLEKSYSIQGKIHVDTHPLLHKF